ncbi:MAG: hypothetical protein RR383_06835 [Muribaculaceae bacterium]
MKSLSLDVAFPRPLCDIEELKNIVKESGNMPSLTTVDELSANELRRWYGLYLAKHARYGEAIALLEEIDCAIDTHLHTASIWYLKMAKDIAKCNYDDALKDAEIALKNMSEIENKRSDDFQAILAAILYDLAFVHYSIGANDCAEKDLAKSQKILERLAKSDSHRFAAALLIAVEASTKIFKSRLKQINTLVHYQAATATYLEGLAHGVAEAGKRLIDSLINQGDMLSQMGNYRESVKYYTKALRYQKKLSGKFAIKELKISINLGKALLHLVNRRDTGTQLLTSLIPLAQRLGANAEISEINGAINNKPKLFDVMGIIKNLIK